MGSICSSSRGEQRKPGAIVETKTDGTLQTASDPRAARLVLPLEISQRYSLKFSSQSRFDISSRDYRAFCLLIHRKHGALLLHCTRKKKKPPHYQLPGGHVDDADFKKITRSLANFATLEQLYYAARLGCAREVYEETGLDFRNRLGEFLPMILSSAEQRDLKDETLINEHKSRIFFVCEVFDDDFPYAVRTTAKKSATKLLLVLYGNIKFSNLVLNLCYLLYSLLRSSYFFHSTA